jgi:hypothetical protein
MKLILLLARALKPLRPSLEELRQLVERLRGEPTTAGRLLDADRIHAELAG